jgi:sodium-coupled neutral amino acid transporter 11
MAIVVATTTGINIGKLENRWVKRATLVGIAIGAVLPLALLKNMAALAKTSFLSLAAVVVILGVVIKNAAMGPGDPDDAPTFLTSKDPADAELRVVDSKFFPAVGVIAFAFVCHHACFIVFNTLRDNTEARWAKTVHSTLLVASGVMGTLAMCAFLTFRGVIKPSFLTNYSKKDPLCNFMRCLFAVTQTLTYPIELFVARHSLHAIAFPAQKWTDEQHYVITLLLWGSSVAIALNVADLGAVLELTGGVAAVSIGFLVPSILHFKMTPEVNYKCWQARGAAKKWAACKVFGRSWFVLCLGVLAMLFTLVSMVDHMTAGGGHGDGIDAFDPTIEYDQYGIPIVNANGVTSGHGSITADSSGTGQLSLT